jgi:Tol biopolymer transport system component
MGSRRFQTGFGFLIAAVLLLAAVPPTQATYRGQNGKISFDVYGSDNIPTVFTMDPDGSNRTPIAPGGLQSAWSPDGQRIAYACQSQAGFFPANTCTANPDGSAVNVLDNFDLVPQRRPFWSPDGRRLIIDDYTDSGHGSTSTSLWRIDSADGGDQIHMAGNGYSGSWSPNGQIVYTELITAFEGPSWSWVSRVYGSNPNVSERLTESEADFQPDWSPDGTKIVFGSCRAPGCALYTMNADGSNEAEIPNSSSADRTPVWSPDGTQILFVRGGDLYLINPDGTGATNITNTPTVTELDPAWQPVPQPGYPRPKGATPVRVSLVPAFDQCETPNRTHGPPLAQPSCSAPHLRAGFMTFGGTPASTSPKAAGNVRLDAMPGAPGSANEADVRISASLVDVRRKFDLADGPGSLELHVPIRLTDKFNGAFNSEQATMQDFDLTMLLPCAETADPAIGSTCSATTTANALIPQGFPRPSPDFVTEGHRAIWQLGQISVWDGGDDGFIESTDDNTVLAVQGVFVP